MKNAKFSKEKGHKLIFRMLHFYIPIRTFAIALKIPRNKFNQGGKSPVLRKL